MIMGSDKCSNRTEYCRKMYGFGFHPTATRALMLLGISTHVSRANEYLLCPFTTKDILPFCIDPTQVLVVDISQEYYGWSKRQPFTCLVVDDDPESAHIAADTWSRSSPPQHFVFASMCFHRALDWVRKWKQRRWRGCDAMKRKGVSLDMHNTHAEKVGTFGCAFPSQCHLVELTLPSTVSATCVSDSFFSGCSALTSVDLSPLTNVTMVRYHFLHGCSALTSLDLTSLANVSGIEDDFLSFCSALTSLDLSTLVNVTEIGDGFLRMSNMFGGSALRSLVLPPLTKVKHIGRRFLDGCSALTSLDL
eukprot:PhM_4_TR6083/c0_g1_i1/m.74633